MRGPCSSMPSAPRPRPRPRWVFSRAATFLPPANERRVTDALFSSLGQLDPPHAHHSAGLPPPRPPPPSRASRRVLVVAARSDRVSAAKTGRPCCPPGPGVSADWRVPAPIARTPMPEAPMAEFKHYRELKKNTASHETHLFLPVGRHACSGRDGPGRRGSLRPGWGFGAHARPNAHRRAANIT